MKKVKGFSLIEVIVAIVLLGIVATGIMPSLSFSYRNLRQSQVFTQDTYDYQEKIEKLIEEKKGVDPTDPLTTRSVTIFGKSVKGHIIRVNDKTSSDMTVFVAKDSIPNVVPILAAAPEIKVYNGATLYTPASPLDITNASLTMKVQDPQITDATKPAFLLNVYRWYLSEEMDNSQTAPDKTKQYTAIKEWNEAKAELSFANSENLSFIPNIQTDYSTLNMTTLKTALSLTDEEWINQFGNRYVMYGVTPYATSGRIGKELLSNKIYVNAPRLSIVSAKSTTDPKVVEVKFDSVIKTITLLENIVTNPALGNLVSAERLSTDSKGLRLTFDQNHDITQSYDSNNIYKGGVESNTYGEISVWGLGFPDGRFVIDPYNAIIATGLTVSPLTATVGNDETVQLTATLTPVGASETLVWSSSNNSVATVANGLVTGKAVGTAIITVKTVDGRLSAISTITVIKKPKIVEVGYLKDLGLRDTKLNKVYVAFDEAITHVNLSPINVNHKIELEISGSKIYPINFEYVGTDKKAILLYFDPFDKTSGNLTILGAALKINDKDSNFIVNNVNKIVGNVAYRLHGFHTISNKKYLTVIDTNQIGQKGLLPGDSQLWQVKYTANPVEYDVPINRFKFDDNHELYLISQSINKYLEVRNNNNNDTLVRLGNNSGTSNQKFRIDRLNNGVNGEYLKLFTLNGTVTYTTHVLDISGGSTGDYNPPNDDGRLIRWTDKTKENESDNQRFMFEPVIEFTP